MGLNVDRAVISDRTIRWLPPVTLMLHGDDIGTHPIPAGGGALIQLIIASTESIVPVALAADGDVRVSIKTGLVEVGVHGAR